MAKRHRTGDNTPDLFAVPASRPGPAAIRPPTPRTEPGPRYILPADIAGAVGSLADEALRKLAGAVDRELRRRNLPPPREAEAKTTTPAAAPPASKPARGGTAAAPSALTQGRINAIRAAFKAGVKPSQIARQFGVSQTAIRRALSEEASDHAGRR